jgi:hypothetical protein
MTLEGSVVAHASIERGPTRFAVWPVAALFGATSAAAASSGAWLAARPGAAGRPWTLVEWGAEHALWGTAIGAALALLLRCGARVDPSLGDAGRRRAASARLAVLCVAAGGLALLAALAGPHTELWSNALRLLAGASLGLGAAWYALARWVGRGARFASLPALDPSRVSVALALLTLPLASSGERGWTERAAAELAFVAAPAAALGAKGELDGLESARSTSRAAPLELEDPKQLAGADTLVSAWRRLLGP